jgi:hypothetical protein
MKTFPPDYLRLEDEIIKHQLTKGLRQTLDRNFQRIFEAAKTEWERNYAGNDPSDACVSVRISTPGVRSAGILRKRQRSLLNGHGRHVPA